MLATGADKCQLGKIGLPPSRANRSALPSLAPADGPTRCSMNAATSAYHSKNLYTPVQPAFQKQGGGLSRLERIAKAAERARNGGWGYGGSTSGPDARFAGQRSANQPNKQV